MTHDEAFLQAITDNPDDDAPRLLYADWLEERGDPRGEFIRVQCALAGMDEYDPRRWDLAAREREIRDEHGDQWIGSLPSRLEAWTHRRGFIDSITAGCEELQTVVGALLRRGPPPEVRVRLGAPRGHVARISECAAEYKITRLTILGFDDGQWPLDAADVEALASSPGLVMLRSLTFEGGLGPEGVRRLIEAPWLSALRHLGLPGCEIGAAGVEGLAGCPALGGLEGLDLEGNRLTAVAMQALSASSNLLRLRRLNLASNEIDAAGAAALAANPKLARLERLELSANPIGDRGVDSLAKSHHLTGLKDLRLARTRLRAAGVRSLVRSPVGSGLTSLDLAQNHLLAAGTAALAEGDLAPLKGLDLTRNEIGDEGLKALASSRNMPGLRTLRLGANGLRVWSLKELTTSASWPDLQALDLHSNQLEDRGLQVLARWPRLKGLAVLNFHSNAVGDLGAKDLAASIHLAGLRDVDLSGNSIGPEGRAALMSSPLGDARRVTLNLSGNRYDDDVPF